MLIKNTQTVLNDVSNNTNHGNIAMHLDIARTNFKVNGTGITAGTLLDSYDYLGNAESNVTSGELLSVVYVLDDIDEGQAMMQIITEIVP